MNPGLEELIEGLGVLWRVYHRRKAALFLRRSPETTQPLVIAQLHAHSAYGASTPNFR